MSKKPDLRHVTLMLADHRRPAAGVRLLAAHAAALELGDIKFLNFFQGEPQFNYWENFEAWKYLRTDFAMFVQFDGYVVRPDLWDPAFLRFDYIGAPWPDDWKDHDSGRCRVGNGGFSIKSRALMNRVAALPGANVPGDILVCSRYRAQLEAEGFTFAPAAVAARFSVEHRVPETPAATFGFHGPKGSPAFAPWSDEQISIS